MDTNQHKDFTFCEDLQFTCDVVLEDLVMQEADSWWLDHLQMLSYKHGRGCTEHLSIGGVNLTNVTKSFNVAVPNDDRGFRCDTVFSAKHLFFLFFRGLVQGEYLGPFDDVFPIFFVIDDFDEEFSVDLQSVCLLVTDFH